MKTKLREKTRVQRNQESAKRALWDIHAAQQSARITKVADSDGDGTGEFLSLAELMGLVAVRGTESKFTDNSNVKSRLGSKLDRGRGNYSGYLFEIWLPDGESWSVSAGDASSMSRYRCYAWPLEYGESGQVAFYLDERGDIYASGNQRTTYEGHGLSPVATAAEGELSELHPDDRYLGEDGGWWGKTDFVPAGPPPSPPK